MGTEVDRASGDIQANITTPSSTTTTSVPKTSMFAKKSGFVIPKNKLSGSLVPIYRGPKKGDADLMKEEAATNQVVRKTKWGPDLTLDTTVRKGRALAYQTRINQISQQLTLGTLEVEDNQDFLSTSDHQLTKEESNLLEIEKREIIGEVLKLNPTYKAPADYKPLLKETKVPIPIKEYPGYNFIGLVYGPGNDTQKRLEKETGAKIQVYGKKSDSGEKFEIVTPTDGKEVDDSYEDLYVHVSADTFEKIDEAVALIELLLTHVSVNSMSSSTIQTSISDTNVNTHHSSTSSSIIAPPPLNQGTTQPHPGPLPPHQGQLPQYPQAWFHANPTHTQPLLSNTVQVSSSPFNPTAYGSRPSIAPSFSPVLQNHSVFPPRPQNALQPLYMQQAPSLLGQSGGPRNTHGSSLSGSPYDARPIISTSLPATLPIVPSRPPQVNIPNNMITPSFGHPSQSESARSAIQPSPGGPARPGFFGGSHNFDSARPLPASGFRPQQTSSGDFTFQPQHHPWQSNQPTNHNSRPPVQPGLGPHPPMLRPVMGNLNPSSVQTFPRLQMNHPTNFSANPTVPFPSRHPMLPTGQHMQQSRNFIPPQHMNNPSGPFHQRPGPQMHIPENHLRPQQRFLSPHQHFGNHHHHPGRPFSSSSGPPQQVYDPFSPSSVPFHPQMGGNRRVLSESDPEYEDLMASVGVQ